MSEGIRETNLDDDGLWIPPDLREFEVSITIRTPRATIQHFGSGPLGPHYGMVDDSHFRDAGEFRDPKNPHLAPDRVELKARGQEPVALAVDLEPELLSDGGQTHQSRCQSGRKCAVGRLHLKRAAINWWGGMWGATAHPAFKRTNLKGGESR
jgi:hypothetical protein